MDDQRAKDLLKAETERLTALLHTTESEGRQNRDAQDEDQEADDSAEQLTAEGVDDALAEGFRQRLEAVQRAEQRLADGTYGLSVRSGAPIPDERLEFDPAAELTVEEATEDQQD
ncbi:TraR/DksA family transcriptional regulator [Aeromicrobium sp.]|uniref:TraR/DksA family transcriptional regulator n=1 Tax=Aeromicrobium sp. TaxID=1871063 RepID=UPI003C47CBD0